MVEIKAKLNYLRVAPRKARLLADLIRGLNIKDAKIQAGLSQKKVGGPMLKLLGSAEANAKHNFMMDADKLVVGEIKVDPGPVLKRFKPRARGRATMIRRRSSHITVVLSELQKKSKIKLNLAKRL